MEVLGSPQATFIALLNVFLSKLFGLNIVVKFSGVAILLENSMSTTPKKYFFKVFFPEKHSERLVYITIC